MLAIMQFRGSFYPVPLLLICFIFKITRALDDAAVVTPAVTGDVEDISSNYSLNISNKSTAGCQAGWFSGGNGECVQCANLCPPFMYISTSCSADMNTQCSFCPKGSGFHEWKRTYNCSKTNRSRSAEWLAMIKFKTLYDCRSILEIFAFLMFGVCTFRIYFFRFESPMYWNKLVAHFCKSKTTEKNIEQKSYEFEGSLIDNCSEADITEGVPTTAQTKYHRDANYLDGVEVSIYPDDMSNDWNKNVLPQCLHPGEADCEPRNQTVIQSMFVSENEKPNPLCMKNIAARPLVNIEKLSASSPDLNLGRSCTVIQTNTSPPDSMTSLWNIPLETSYETPFLPCMCSSPEFAATSIQDTKRLEFSQFKPYMHNSTLSCRQDDTHLCGYSKSNIVFSKSSMVHLNENERTPVLEQKLTNSHNSGSIYSLSSERSSIIGEVRLDKDTGV